MEKLYADIIINISHEALDKVFAYKVPFSMIKDIRVGQQVVVPFGRSNKEQTGYVVNLSRTVDYDESKVKEILRIETDHVGVESNMIELAAWIRENYGSTMIQALKTVLPVQEKVARKARKYIELCIEKVHGPAMLDEYFSKHYVAKARLLAALLDHGKISWEMASKDLKISKSTVDSMEREGILHVVTEYYYRNPGEFSIAKAGVHVLNEQQQELIDEFREDFLREDHKTVFPLKYLLLHQKMPIRSVHDYSFSSLYPYPYEALLLVEILCIMQLPLSGFQDRMFQYTGFHTLDKPSASAVHLSLIHISEPTRH